jgi:hypothetical protein
MAKRKCRFCGDSVEEEAVICIHCGTNQKTGKSLRAHNVRKKKSFSKILLILLLLAVIITGAFHLYNWYRQRSLNAAVMAKQDDTVAPEPDKDIGGLKKTINFPLSITEAKDADKYQVYTSIGIGFSTRKNSSGTATTEGRINLNTRALPPKGVKGSFRLKIYSGKSSNGEYELIYDRIAKAKMQKPKACPSQRERLLELPDKYKNAPDRIKKRILEQRKKAYGRIKIPERKAEPVSFCAFFSYSNNKFEISSGQQNLYFRVFLCDPEGRVIKESLPKRFAVRRPRSQRPRTNDRSVVHGLDSSSSYSEGNTIYPFFYGANRALKFTFIEKGAFKIISLYINGIKYSPVFTGSLGRMGTYTNRKTGVKKTYYNSSMSLKYPFGGQVKLKFKHKTSSGKFKKETLSFYLPPPPPLIRLKASEKGDMVNVSWDKIESGMDKSNFFKVPKLILERNRREFKNLPIYQQNNCVDKEVFRGEPINYKISFKNGVLKAVRWNSKKGIENYKLEYNGQVNPFLKRGINITVPSLSKETHPVRIELLKNLICYENTGITSCKLLKAVINTVNKEKDMVFYDRDSRNYIIDEKYFALSDSLKKQFLIKESDYAVQIKDYSRQDGNGVELWLFKKRVEGAYANKKTIYWRIADIRIDGNETNMLNAAKRLIAKIRETLEFRACADKRKKSIKPKNVICPAFRPVNQKYVMRNYEAVCESLFLLLGEKSDTIRILSKDDWEQIFNERISRFDKGYNFIDSTVREVLLMGRLWRNGKVKTYYIQACDAFSGEVLGSKIFSGKKRNVASELAEWLKELRLSDDIKVDFPMSKFHKRVKLRPWRPREDLLENYGPSIEKPLVRRAAIKRRQTTRQTTQKGSFYVFVKRQWKDGYRAKAISLLKKDWIKSKKIKTGSLLGHYYIESKRYQDAIDLFEKDWGKIKSITTGSRLSSYYIAAKRYRDAIAVYDEMLLLDDCPMSVYTNYNLIKRKATGEKLKPIVKKEKKKTPKSSTSGTGTLVMSNIKTNDAMDYRATYTSYISGKAVRTKIPRKHTSNSQDLEKYYFIDRDKIYPEWAPNQPCKTAKLVFSIPGKILSEGIYSSAAKKYGVWTKAFRLGPSESYPLYPFFKSWRYLPRRPYRKPKRYTRRNIAAEKRQMQSVCKTRVIVFENGWNSINPFSETLNKTLSYTRLGYFFEMYSRQSCLADRLYHHSKIRAFFELKKNPQISFPRFTFAVPSIHKAFVSQIRTGKDMIRYWALELAKLDSTNKKRKDKLNIRYLELHQMLALNYIVKHESNTTLKRIYRTIKSTPIPTTLEAYRKSSVGTNFLVLMAYKKKKKAVKMLHLLLDKRGYISGEERSNYAYVLAQAGYVRLTMRMAPSRGLARTTLRWFPAKILDKVSGSSPYLIFGTRNDNAARKWFLRYNGGNAINHYFGKPPAEAYRNWKIDHFKRVKELKNNSKKEKAVK